MAAAQRVFWQTGFTKLQPVVLLQFPPLEAAEFPAQEGRPAAHNERNVDPAGKCDICAAACFGIAQRQRGICFGFQRLIARDRSAVELRVHVRAGKRKDSVLREAQRWAEHGRFQSRLAICVSDQQICIRIGELVGSACGGYAVLLQSIPSTVLYGGQKSGHIYDNCHDHVSFRLRTS